MPPIESTILAALVSFIRFNLLTMLPFLKTIVVDRLHPSLPNILLDQFKRYAIQSCIKPGKSTILGKVLAKYKYWLLDSSYSSSTCSAIADYEYFQHQDHQRRIASCTIKSFGFIFGVDFCSDKVSLNDES